MLGFSLRSSAAVRHWCSAFITTRPVCPSISLPVRLQVTACAKPPAATQATPPKTFNVRRITKDDVDFTFARSGGAGGQNVNKVNTKVDMRFELDKQVWIPDEVKDAVRRMEKNRFTKEGELVMTSTRHRTQAQNISDCLDKLQEILDSAVEAVTPKEVDPAVAARVKKNIAAGQRKRLDEKKKDSVKKAARSQKSWD